MRMQATATATVTNWDEKAYDETPETAKTAEAQITYTYEGGLSGEGHARLLLAYSGSEAEFVGLERMTATLEGRTGTFVTSQTGAFRDGVARWTFQIVPGTGTGALTGLSGSGSGEAPMGNQATLSLEYEL
jgi:hypothetical protein